MLFALVEPGTHCPSNLSPLNASWGTDVLLIVQRLAKEDITA